MTEKHVAALCPCCVHDTQFWCRKCKAWTHLDYLPDGSGDLAYCAGCHRRILPSAP